MSKFKKIENHHKLTIELAILLKLQKSVDDIEECIMESEVRIVNNRWIHIGIMCMGILTKFSNNVLDLIKLFFCVWPKNQHFFQKIKEPFHDVFVLLISTIVECNFNKKV